MHPLKASGSDGFPSLFYQRYWSIVGKDVIKKMLNILNGRDNPDSINQTFICLIPKVKQPEHQSEFDLISLCNFIMKLVTKCIANKVKKFLEEVIGEQQSAFIIGRLIMDNALTGFEVFHCIKKKKKDKKMI